MRADLGPCPPPVVPARLPAMRADLRRRVSAADTDQWRCGGSGFRRVQALYPLMTSSAQLIAAATLGNPTGLRSRIRA
jgi:hypothetical protein